MLNHTTRYDQQMYKINKFSRSPCAGLRSPGQFLFVCPKVVAILYFAIFMITTFLIFCTHAICRLTPLSSSFFFIFIVEIRIFMYSFTFASFQLFPKTFPYTLLYSMKFHTTKCVSPRNCYKTKILEHIAPKVEKKENLLKLEKGHFPQNDFNWLWNSVKMYDIYGRDTSPKATVLLFRKFRHQTYVPP